ncbi:MAG: SHOCT domain-containing protein [Mycobacterium sp.]|nr:SHOCT domain-containing protein [Mycobacterium sp.]
MGVRAYADVLAVEQSSLSVTAGNPNLLGNTEIRWKLQLRVLPTSEPPFDATVHALLPQLSRPRAGTRVAVRYDPKDHGRVELDQQPAATADTAIAAITNARPDLTGAQVMGMPMTDMIRQAIADPDAFREEMMQRSAEMQQRAMNAVQAAQAQAADPVDRLERLAALKDRGLITDEEFAQQKRRILGES